MIAKLASLLLFSFASFAHGAGPQCGDTKPEALAFLDKAEAVCDERLVDALKIEISKTVCLEKMDPVCLRHLYSAEFQKSPLGMSSLRDPSTPKKVINGQEIDTWLFDRARLDQGLKVSGRKAFEEWVEPGSRLDASRPFSARRLKDSATGTVDFAAALLAVGKALPFAGTAIGLVDDVTKAFNPEGSKSELDPSNCPAHALRYINAQRLPNGDCVRNYNLQSDPVRRFLRLPAADQKKSLQCDTAACAYYSGMLRTLYRANKALEASMLADVKQYPTCEGPGRAKLRIEYPAASPKYQLVSEVTANLEKSRTSRTPSLHYTTTANGHVISGIVPRRAFTLTYNRGKKGELSSILQPTVALNPDAISNPTKPGTPVEVEPHGKNQESRVLRVSSVMSAMAAACCDQNDSHSCFTKNFSVSGNPFELPTSRFTPSGDLSEPVDTRN